MFKRLPAAWFFVAPLLVAFSAGVAAPIPNGKDAPTKAAWIKQLAAWQLRRVECYRQHTRDPEKIRGAAVAFLTADVARFEQPSCAIARSCTSRATK